MLFLAATGSLTGCDTNLGQGPTAVRNVDGNLQIAMCESVEVSRISASYREKRFIAYLPRVEFLDLVGRKTLEPGQLLEVGRAVEGFDAKLSENPALDIEGDMEILLWVAGSDDVSTSAFLMPSGGVPVDGWLQPDGDVTDEPCPTE
ncbi:hypothetical protein DDQ50_05335 [Amnibacterium flavum]|uniref:Uncharacterized protein n=1 Tax=Amnibacterium flavum TaxID=2173173 RepID=A0A2V1HX81_9MICO|nr:hypothetical protein DDQ50_05335 [Amnibacterium flavum]